MVDLEQLKRELLGVTAIVDPTERLLEAAAIIGEAVADLGVEPIVVGGLAIAYWTSGEIQTGDIDVVLPRAPELPNRLTSLGLVHRPGVEAA